MIRVAALLLAGSVSLPVLAGQRRIWFHAARAQIGVIVRYDSSYQRIEYPGGDVPIDRGVCTDVVDPRYRRIGIDLQAVTSSRLARRCEYACADSATSRKAEVVSGKRCTNFSISV